VPTILALWIAAASEGAHRCIIGSIPSQVKPLSMGGPVGWKARFMHPN
jgi:hypothetical protein